MLLKLTALNHTWIEALDGPAPTQEIEHLAQRVYQGKGKAVLTSEEYDTLLAWARGLPCYDTEDLTLDRCD